MKAVQFVKFGKPSSETLTISETKTLSQADAGADEVLIQVKAVSINPIDKKILGGDMKPMINPKPGTTVALDFAGIVEYAGANVSHVQAGDEVYGASRDWGVLQEKIVISGYNVAKKPKNLSLEEAAALPVAAITALQAIESAKVTPESVKTALIPAGLGGVGYTALQILKNVIGVDRVVTTVSTGKVALAEQLLPDVEIIDYKKENFGSKLSDQVDYILDTTFELGKDSQAIKKNGTVFSIAAIPGGTGVSKHFGIPVNWFVRNMLDLILWFHQYYYFSGKNVLYDFFFLKMNTKDLSLLSQWVEEGKVHVLIDKTFDFQDAIEAISYQAQGSCTGKVVIRVNL